MGATSSFPNKHVPWVPFPALCITAPRLACSWNHQGTIVRGVLHNCRHTQLPRLPKLNNDLHRSALSTMAEERKDGGVAGEPGKVTKDVSECPVDTVTVFSDRAEVTRRVRLDFEAAGDFEVIVEGLPSCIDGDSVRVNGTGHVMLREVSYAVHHKPVVAVVATDDTANSPEVLQQTLEALEKDIAALNTRATEIQRSKELLTA